MNERNYPNEQYSSESKRSVKLLFSHEFPPHHSYGKENFDIKINNVSILNYRTLSTK